MSLVTDEEWSDFSCNRNGLTGSTLSPLAAWEAAEQALNLHPPHSSSKSDIFCVLQKHWHIFHKASVSWAVRCVRHLASTRNSRSYSCSCVCLVLQGTPEFVAVSQCVHYFEWRTYTACKSDKFKPHKEVTWREVWWGKWWGVIRKKRKSLKATESLEEFTAGHMLSRWSLTWNHWRNVWNEINLLA